MVDIASRKSWGAKHDDGDLTLSGLATNVVIHHSVTKVSGSTVEAERAHMRYLETVGEGRFGRGISYNVLVFPSGRAYQGVSFNRRGTHTGGHNSTRRSICYVGNFEEDTPTQAALDTGRAIIAKGRGLWWRKDAPVEGHRDYTSTACPGENLYARLDYLAAGSTAAAPREFHTEYAVRRTQLRKVPGGEVVGTLNAGDSASIIDGSGRRDEGWQHWWGETTKGNWLNLADMSETPPA